MIGRIQRQMFNYIAAAVFTGIFSWSLSGDLKSQYEEWSSLLMMPPLWLIVGIWLLIYALMGLAFYEAAVSIAKFRYKQKAARYYKLQLFLNFLWCIVLFRFSSVWGGAAVLTIINLLLLTIVRLFYYMNKKAAYLMIPYFIWNIYMLYLNLSAAIQYI